MIFKKTLANIIQSHCCLTHYIFSHVPQQIKFALFHSEVIVFCQSVLHIFLVNCLALLLAFSA